MDKMQAYADFIKRFKLLIGKNPDLIKITLSNIFTMRLIGNKTHGDLAEIAIAEFVNQFMYDFRSIHVGKDLYRAKQHEEDILITNEIEKVSFPISLKAYGDGPLQLSTDKNFRMFPKLQEYESPITQKAKILEILRDSSFADMSDINILPLIYDEKHKRCNIMVFTHQTAIDAIDKIVLEEAGKGRKHPVYRFYDKDGDYICEVRYGDAAANALQRGLWTHTKHAKEKYFDSITDGWIDYADNHILVKLFSHALVAAQKGHEEALEVLKVDIDRLKKSSNLR
jgi:hypothetical protein